MKAGSVKEIKKTMFYFGDSDTGYYDEEERFYALDAEHEAAEKRRYLEELEASHGCEFDTRPIEPDIDPDTGCSAVEMDEADRMPLRFLKVDNPTPSDAASRVTFPPEMSVGQTIAARWGRGARRRRGVA